MTNAERERAYDNRFVETPTNDIITWARELIENMGLQQSRLDRKQAVEVIYNLYRR